MDIKRNGSQLEGKSADWMEQISDEQYQAGSSVE